MEGAIRAILERRGISIECSESEQIVSGFEYLGMAPRVSETGLDGEQVHIWLITQNILPLSENELIRWSFEAPQGKHWLLSQRETPTNHVDIDDCDYVIWDPQTVSQWIGNAVLSGDVIAKSANDISGKPDASIDFSETKSAPKLAMRPIIEIRNWLSQRGLDAAQHNPAFLEAKIWEVSGNLLGPNGELERGSWQLFEDPWGRTLSLLEPNETLEGPPELRVISPPEENWLSTSRLSEEASKLLETRRKGDESYSESSIVRSMLLQKWSFESSSARYSETRLLLPAWIIQNPTEIAIHARNGRTHEF